MWVGLPAEIPREVLPSRRGLAKAWTACVLFYAVGVWLVVFGDFRYGGIEPVSLRRPLMVLGAVMMVAAAFWMQAIHETLRRVGGEP